MPYSTKQHQAVLRCLEARGETACTAAELAEDLRREGCPVPGHHLPPAGKAGGRRGGPQGQHRGGRPVPVLRPPVPRPPGLLSSEV